LVTRRYHAVAGVIEKQMPAPVLDTPCSVAEGAADEVAQIGGGAALEPGVITDVAEEAELEPPSASGGEGDHRFDIRSIFPVILTQAGLADPLGAGGAQLHVVLVQAQGPAF
jgi:hypothetical protein